MKTGAKLGPHYGRVPDVIRPGLDALFIGINPDPISARERHHFANPSNPFWKILYESGFTSRKLAPNEEGLLLEENLGITNFIARETRGMAELTREDIAHARIELAHKLRLYRPRALVFVGISGYRMFSGSASAILCGEQPERIDGARVFVLPHPSGRNVHFRRSEMLEHWRAVARSLGRISSPDESRDD